MFIIFANGTGGCKNYFEIDGQKGGGDSQSSSNFCYTEDRGGPMHAKLIPVDQETPPCPPPRSAGTKAPSRSPGRQIQESNRPLVREARRLLLSKEDGECSAKTQFEVRNLVHQFRTPLGGHARPKKTATRGESVTVVSQFEGMTEPQRQARASLSLARPCLALGSPPLKLKHLPQPAPRAGSLAARPFPWSKFDHPLQEAEIVSRSPCHLSFHPRLMCLDGRRAPGSASFVQSPAQTTLPAPATRGSSRRHERRPDDPARR